MSALKYSLAMARAGLATTYEVVVAEMLHKSGPHTMREVARGAGVNPARATGIVDRLEAKGLVERAANFNDRRSVKVALTRKGRSLIRRAG